MDHERISLTTGYQLSCGIALASKITDASTEDVLFAIGTYLYHPARGKAESVILYSNTHTEDGDRYKSFFEKAVKMRFGVISFVENIFNVKTGNKIWIVTWVVNHENFRRWWVEQKIERMKERLR